nr:LacI family DNA-binding transcriptional regulator [Fodinicola feengrottensis]
MAVRMRDVAQAAGVSIAAVSLALSGNPRIPAETRDRIRAVAEQMGYRPHAGARALRTEVTGSLGLVISDVANPFFAELAGEIQRAAAAEGFSTVLCNSDEDAGVQDEYLRNLLAGSRVDGVILVPAAAMTEGLLAAGKAKARLVFLDRPVEVRGRTAAARHLAGSPVVRSGASKALSEAAELLTGFGHRRVGIIAPPMTTRVGVERTELMIQSLTARGGGSDPRHQRGRRGFSAGQRRTRDGTAAGQQIPADRDLRCGRTDDYWCDERTARGPIPRPGRYLGDRFRRRALVRPLRSAADRGGPADHRNGDGGRTSDGPSRR